MARARPKLQASWKRPEGGDGRRRQSNRLSVPLVRPNRGGLQVWRRGGGLVHLTTGPHPTIPPSTYHFSLLPLPLLLQLVHSRFSLLFLCETHGDLFTETGRRPPRTGWCVVTVLLRFCFLQPSAAHHCPLRCCPKPKLFAEHEHRSLSNLHELEKICDISRRMPPLV
jgi:hypothetical protein